MAWNESGPTFVPGRAAVEVELVGRMNRTDLFVEPYLSLNQGPIHVNLDHGLERSPASLNPLVGARPSQWRVAADSGG